MCSWKLKRLEGDAEKSLPHTQSTPTQQSMSYYESPIYHLSDRAYVQVMPQGGEGSRKFISEDPHLRGVLHAYPYR